MIEQVPMHAATRRKDLLASAEQLYQNNYSIEVDGCLPSKTRSIVQVYDILKKLVVRKDKIIVFAFDGLSFDFFSQYLLPHVASRAKVTSLTSVFPSTTGCAWPSIVTGAWPAQHGIYGTSFRLEDVGKNYIWISNTFNHGDSRTAPKANVKLNQSGRSNLFTQLKKQGWTTYYNGNHGQGENNPFREVLTKDTIHFSPSNYRDLIDNPQELIDCFLKRTKEVTKKQGSNQVIWNYLNIDDFIHEHGYDALASSVDWKRFFDAWQTMQSDGMAIVLMSDHGQIPQQTCSLNWLNITRNHPWFAADTGGAGRVLYFYPKPEHKTEAYTWLKSNMGKDALVLTREEAFEKGLFTLSLSEASLPDRVGDIIAIAQSGRFVSACNENVVEHGAVTRQEMIVPFLIEEM